MTPKQAKKAKRSPSRSMRTVKRRASLPVFAPNDSARVAELEYSGIWRYGYEFEPQGMYPEDAAGRAALIERNPSAYGIIWTKEDGSVAGELVKAIIEAGLVPDEIEHVVLLCSDARYDSALGIRKLLEAGASVVYWGDDETRPPAKAVIPTGWLVKENPRNDPRQWMYAGDATTEELEKVMWFEVAISLSRNVFEMCGINYEGAVEMKDIIPTLTFGRIACPEGLVCPRTIPPALTADWESLYPEQYQQASLIEDVTFLWNSVMWSKGISISCEKWDDDIRQLYDYAGRRWGIDHMIDALISGVALEHIVSGNDFPLISMRAFQEKRREKDVFSFVF